MKGFIFLALAILLEVFGSTMLKLSDGFTNLWPSVGVAIGFLAAFTLFSFALKTLPLSFAYATWSGAGTALTAVIGGFVFGESFHFLKISGLFLIIFGIALLNASAGKQTQSEKT
ncbi:DMT family transporter [Pseudobacillus badius]|uniref:DMT family transporter n=1 Tax=Bacillus badius TaxID=1455 RepID=UPI000596C302|nr:multidrug efflux SMR transporter [Bacillus badius]KIL76019.1 Ethidium bromide-methyl viologen resistance protein EmrE [Bacillus badius]KZR59661.1 multidrug transporter [Bacillus badius]